LGVKIKSDSDDDEPARVKAILRHAGIEKAIEGRGNGPIDAFLNAVRKELGFRVQVTSYEEHAIDKGSDAKAAAYVEIERPNGETNWGVGIHSSIVTASLRAVVSAINIAAMDGAFA
jgi:2-isopropylmalate synthase